MAPAQIAVNDCTKLSRVQAYRAFTLLCKMQLQYSLQHSFKTVTLPADSSSLEGCGHSYSYSYSYSYSTVTVQLRYLQTVVPWKAVVTLNSTSLLPSLAGSHV